MSGRPVLVMKEADSRTPFKELNHTADLCVEIYGEDEQGLFRNAVESLYVLLGFPAASEPADGLPEATLSLRGQDSEEALVQLLGELLYRATAEGQRLILRELFVRRGEAGEEGCGVFVSGFWCTITEEEGRGKREIKAVTYHNVQIRRTETEWSARVVMDI